MLIAEHGAFVRNPGSDWVNHVDMDPAWKQTVLPILQRYADRCTGAFIEDKAVSLVWHYRNAESEVGRLRSQELKDELRELFSRDSVLQVIEGHKIIEVKKSGYNKGTVAGKLLGTMEYDFLMAIGDDTTDEDLFHTLPPKALTLKVGLSPSLARFNSDQSTGCSSFAATTRRCRFMIGKSPSVVFDWSNGPSEPCQ